MFHTPSAVVKMDPLHNSTLIIPNFTNIDAQIGQLSNDTNFAKIFL